MKRERMSWKVMLGLGLAALLVAGVALIPSVASAEEEATAHDHAAHAAGLEDELAQVRHVTARFHRVEEAIAAGYELGWVNGAGVRIISGCVSHPTAGAMGYHYFNPTLVTDNAVDPLEPEALVYESAPDGGLKLVAVEWVVRGAEHEPAWHLSRRRACWGWRCTSSSRRSASGSSTPGSGSTTRRASSRTGILRSPVRRRPRSAAVGPRSRN